MPEQPPETFGPEHFRRFVEHKGFTLGRLEKEAAQKNIPIVGPAMGKLLYLLARATGARRVLELGTSIGYSAIWLARAVGPLGGKVVTVERDKTAVEAARSNLAEAGLLKQVVFLEGDALELLGRMPRGRPYDLVFNDIDKELYAASLDPIVELLRPGGLAVFDNTAFRSAGDFLDAAMRHSMVEVLHLHCFLPGHDPDFDAVTLCVKKG